MTASFRGRGVALWFVASVVGSAAFQIEGVAIGWQVFQLHHRAFDLGLVGLILFLPALCFAIPAGFVADHVDRRAVAAVCALVEIAGLALFALLVVRGVADVAPYLAALAVVGTAQAFVAPAERSLLADIVEPDRFVRAWALASSATQFVVIGGPALGGVLVAVSTALALAVASALFAVSAFAIVFVRLRTHARDDAPATFHDAFEGIRFIRSRPVVLGAISLDLFAVLFGGATALLPVFADGVFHVGATGLGIMRSMPALGVALAGAALSRRPVKRHVGRILYIVVAGFGIATIVFGLSRVYWLSLAALVAAGAFDMVSMSIRSALVSLGTPSALRGRVIAVENVFIGASNELGAFESGALAALVGPAGSVVAGGLGTLAVIALWWGLFPALRSCDEVEVAA